MRGLGGFALLLVIILVALIWAMTLGPWRDQPLVRQLTTAVSPQAAPAPEPQKQTEAAPKAARKAPGGPARTISKPAEVEVAAALAQEEAPVALAQPQAPLVFPVAADVPAGTLGSYLLEKFGLPTARTTGVDEAGLTETFIYRRSDPDTVTVFQLRNGRVVSSVTTAY